MPNFTRRVWYAVDETGYKIEVRYGARVGRQFSGNGSREECLEKVRALKEEYRADEVRETSMKDL